VSQSEWIAVAIVTGFLLFLAMKGRLANYWALLTGGTGGATGAAPAATPTGIAASIATGGAVGSAIGSAIGGGAGGATTPAATTPAAPAPSVYTFDGVTLPADLFGMVPP
jgi:hypothetical protein